MTNKNRKYSNPVEATITGIRDLFRKRERLPPLAEGTRLDGMTVGITGASAGLGLASAKAIARLGARVLMICRSGIPEKGEEVVAASGNGNVDMYYVDLADLESVSQLVDQLFSDGVTFDVFISNAAMVPAKARRTVQGLEEMFVVNYLSKFYLINQLLNRGMIGSESRGWPRIVVVSSESHRNPESFDWDGLGKFEDYGMRETVNRYGYFKLLLTTFAVELSRRLNMNDQHTAVRALCPGPVNSNIAREAPAVARPLLKLVFRIFFRSPEKACEPVVYFTADRSEDFASFAYLFLMSKADVDEKAMDSENGRRLWQASVVTLEKIGFPIADDG